MTESSDVLNHKLEYLETELFRLQKELNSKEVSIKSLKETIQFIKDQNEKSSIEKNEKLEKWKFLYKIQV